MALIVNFEGMDCSGKSTQAKLLASRLSGEGYAAELLGFPDHESVTGKIIRSHLAEDWKCLHHPGAAKHNEHLDAYVFQALQTVNRLELLPDHSNADVIVCDRLSFSGIAYGLFDGLSVNWLHKIHERLPYPDITFYLDIDKETSMSRLGSRGGADRYEKMADQFDRLSDCYDQAFKLYNDRGVQRLNANQSIVDLNDSCTKYVLSSLGA